MGMTPFKLDGKLPHVAAFWPNLGFIRRNGLALSERAGKILMKNKPEKHPTFILLF